jgi:LysR family transcriptional regulator, glycine cleavage system transcriptional activator
MRRLPPLTALRAFEATARLASVTAAAAELGVSHSAVSQQISQLENYFGQKLFDRPGRRVEMTPAAAALLEDVREAFDRIAAASEQLTRRGVQRIVTISATPSFAMHWIIPRIAAFQSEHPNLELRVTTSAAPGISHLDRPYDLVIRREVMMREGYVCRPLVSDRATPLVHPRLARRLEQREPGDLPKLGLLHARSWPDAWRRWLVEHSGAKVQTLDGPFFDNTSLALQAALSELGAALAPIAFAQDELAEGKLVAPFPDCFISGPGFHVLHSETAQRERGTRELLRWLDLQAGSARTRPEKRTGGDEKDNGRRLPS